MTKSSFWASSLMGKERPYRSLGIVSSRPKVRTCMYALVLEDNDGVGVADGSLQQTLGVLGAVWGDDLEAGDAAVPGRVVLGVLGADAGGETVGATEGDVAGLDTAGHVVCLRGRVDDLVNGLHGEVEGHELALVVGQRWARSISPRRLLTMGCRPASAAPTVRPAKPDSVMGESMTLFSPKRSRRPLVTL
jgi:hypothetical protein